MFVVLIGTVVTLDESLAHPGIFDWSVTIWLALTVLFANFAEAIAEGTREGAGRHAAPDAVQHAGAPARPPKSRAPRNGSRLPSWSRATWWSAKLVI